MSKTKPPELVEFEVDVECPGCGRWSIAVIKVPKDQGAPLCVKKLCAVCQGIQQRGG